MATKIRWLIGVAGGVAGAGPQGVAPGDVTEHPDAIAERYLAHGYATKKLTGDLPRAISPGTIQTRPY